MKASNWIASVTHVTLRGEREVWRKEFKTRWLARIAAKLIAVLDDFLTPHCEGRSIGIKYYVLNRLME